MARENRISEVSPRYTRILLERKILGKKWRRPRRKSRIL